MPAFYAGIYQLTILTTLRDTSDNLFCPNKALEGAGDISHEFGLAVINQVILPERAHKGIYSYDSFDSFSAKICT